LLKRNNLDLFGLEIQFLLALWTHAVVALNYLGWGLKFEAMVENRATLAAYNLLGQAMTTTKPLARQDILASWLSPVGRIGKMLEGLRLKLRKLPWKLQRSFGNLGYSMKFFSGPTARRMKPTTTVSLLAVLIFAGFVLAGGIYDILERPISLLPTANGYSFVIKGTLGQQTLNESLVAGFIYMLGLGGLYMLLRSTRFAYRPRNAYLLLILGTITILLVVAYSTALINSKVGG